jgi:hypothetical protein
MTVQSAWRILTILLAAIQFAAPGIVAVADGAFAKQVRDPGSHVESAGGEQCTPPHAADCTVCRFLSDNSADIAPAIASPAVRGTTVTPAGPNRLDGTVRNGDVRSRAPPALV